MATLYWGGGTGTWDGFTTSNWYTDLARTTLSTRAPSAEDDVIFDSSSNATSYTVTIANGTTVCRSCTISGPATGSVTLAGSVAWYIYGDLTFPATGLTRTYTGIINFMGSGNINTNGVALGNNITFGNSTVTTFGTYTLQSALDLSGGGIIVYAGTLNTNDKTVTAASIGAFNANAVINLAASSVTLSASSAISNNDAFPSATLNASSSTITLSNVSASIGLFNNTGTTFNNVTFSGGTVGTRTILGSNTFNNLTFATLASTNVAPIVFGGNQTITGTLSIPTTDARTRYFLRSDVMGTERTLTVAAVGTLSDIDFRDIKVAGASSPWSGTRLGDCKGNTNITFPAGVNKYVAAASASANWSAVNWALSSGGSGATTNFPLAQDTVIIDNAGFNASTTLTIDAAWNIGTLDASSRTNALTIAGTAGANFYGNIVLSTAITSNYTGTGTYCGRTTQTLTSAGKSFGSFTIDSPGGTFLLSDNYTGSNSNFTLQEGTLDFNNKNVTCSRILVNPTVSSAGAKTLSLGSGTFTTTSGIFGGSQSVSNLTVTSNTATITASGTNASFGFDGITCTFGGNITSSTANALVITYGTTTITNLTLTATNAVAVNLGLQLNGTLTITGTLALAGSATPTYRKTVFGSGGQRTLSAATVTGLQNIDFLGINATGAANWTTGTNIGDRGDNAGITFTAAKTVYWNLTGTQNWSATGWATGSGGTPAAANFPLAQDTAVFDDAGAATTVTLDTNWAIGTIDMSARTSAMTIAGAPGVILYGNLTLGSGVTWSHNGGINFSSAGTQTLTTNGRTLTSGIGINKTSGEFRLGDAATITGLTTIVSGTFTTQNYNLTTAGLSSSGSTARTITLGTSTVTCTGTSPINFGTSTNLTLNASSSTILSSSTSTSGKTFSGGGLTFGTVSSTGGTIGPLFISGNNVFGTLTNTARTYLIFASGATQEVGSFTYSGAFADRVRWYANIPGARATLKTSSNAVGVNSVDGGNNVGLSFTGTAPDYFYVKDIAYQTNVPSTGNFLMFLS